MDGKVLIDEANLRCKVVEILDDSIRVVCLNTYTLGENKKINLPGAVIDLPILSEKDEDDLLDFGLE